MTTNRYTHRSPLSCFFFLFALFFCIDGFAQQYNDGPIELKLRVRDINVTFSATDESLLGVGFAPDELVFKLWGRDDADLDGNGWQGGTCLQDDFSPPTQSMDFNHEFYSHTYGGPDVPQYFDLRLDAFEEDVPDLSLIHI